jgi:hypothetical protein
MPSIEVDRERTIQALCAHYASDHLTTQELELRFEKAYKAHDAAELQTLLINLPALPPMVPAPFYSMAPQRASGSVGTPEKRYLAVMSEVKKTGEWIVSPRTVATAIMGNIRLDLRDALLPGTDMEIEATAIMGEVRVIVPPGVRLECDGFAFMGEFASHHSGADTMNGPTLRIHGSSVMGSVGVETRLPGESKLEAWRRRRRER